MRLRTLFILWLLGPVSVWASSVTAVDFDQANPPYMYEARGGLHGIFPAVCRVVFRRMRLPVELRARPWARALEELNTGQAGLCGLYKTAERARRLDFSHYLMQDTILVYSRDDQPVHYRDIHDLAGLRVGVMRGWSYGDLFDQHRWEGVFIVSPVAHDEQNFKMLASRRIDCFLAIPESVAQVAPGFPNIHPAPTPVAVNPSFLAFSKSVHAQDLLARFNLELENMRASGEFQEIVDQEISDWVALSGVEIPE